MFEIASQKKLRFATMKGGITTEDLWDLPLTSTVGPSLENIWQDLNKKIKEADSNESPFGVKSTTDRDLETKFSIVKRVIEVRLKMAEARKNAVVKKEKNEQILRLIYDKENDALAGKSIEDLRKMLDD